MPAATIPGLDTAPTKHQGLLAWVAEVAELTQPDRVVFADGSEEEYQRMCDHLVAAGTFQKLNPDKQPNSYLAMSDPSDVARVESRTFICSEREIDAGPTNNWMDPAEMRTLMSDLYRGSMRGRTMYVVPFCMGPLDAEDPKLGVEITDSEYVVVSMRTMTRMGQAALDKMGTDGFFVKALHSIGAPLQPGQADVPWPCNDTKYITHFPETREIWSFGSGYGGNALLGKKCYSLRIASAMARDEGWMAEHMLILKLISPENKAYYVAAAFPSACGKTNLAMLIPPEGYRRDGWKVWTVGDDICWMRPGADGRLYAINPEAGYFGVAPGTSAKTNANALAMLNQDAIFTNVGVTADNQPWWEGLPDGVPVKDWQGRDYDPKNGPAAHPNSRFTVSAKQCPSYTAKAEDPQGVPLSAIVFGGRRESLVPLVFEARDWTHGVLVGASMASETTAAATGAVGIVRRDSMAMKPFCGYNFADYFAHWLSFDKPGARLPKIFHVNWFRKGADGKFLWPGFGDNLRVIEWMLKRVEGTADAVATPIGNLPKAEDLNTNGLGLDAAAVDELLYVDREGWYDVMENIGDYFNGFGDRTPAALKAELQKITAQLA